MKFEIENRYIAPAINLLGSIPLKNKKSIARSKLVKLLTKKLREFQDDDMLIIKEFANLDESGEPKRLETTYDIPLDKLEECGKNRTELTKEVAVIEGGEYVNHINIVEEALEETELELTGIDAEVYEVLIEAFEQARKVGKK